MPSSHSVPLRELIRARLPLMVALALSAALHAALLLAVRVGQVERAGHVPPHLTVRLTPLAPPAETRTAAAPEPAPQPAPAEPMAEPVHDAQPERVPERRAAATPEPAREGMPEEAAGATTLDLPLPPDPTYYPARQVDEHPVLLSGGKPVYPEEAARANVRGEVIVLMLLNEHGRADEVSIVEARPPGMGFEEAVIAWLRDARFKPALRQGRAVKARVVYHVTFEP